MASYRFGMSFIFFSPKVLRKYCSQLWLNETIPKFVYVDFKAAKIRQNNTFFHCLVYTADHSLYVIRRTKKNANSYRDQIFKREILKLDSD